MRPVAGATLTSLRLTEVNAADMRFWSELLHDPNPIHLDRNAVRAMGLGERLINQGPANLAYLIAMLQRALPQARLQSLEVRYVDNLFEGEAAEASGIVTKVSTEEPLTIDCDVWLRAAGRVVIQGTASLLICGTDPAAATST